jgi:ribosomal protein S25
MVQKNLEHRTIIQLVQTEPQSTTRVMVVAEMVRKNLEHRTIIQLVQTEPQSTTRVMVVAEMVQKNLEHRTIIQLVPTGIDINVESSSEEADWLLS